MTWATRVTAAATVIGATSVIAAVARSMMMPAFSAWQTEVVAVFMRGLLA